MRYLVLLCAISWSLSGCATSPPGEGRAWARIDGRAVAPQQTQADVAICRAAAVNAGRPGVVNNSGVYVNTGDQDGRGIIGDIEHGIQRQRSESATMEACMAQRGYVLG
jgi:hypothetical protein